MNLTLVPAYGRDYKSAKEVVADWEANKDFLINDISSQFDGKYINRLQVPPNSVIKIRYKQLRQTRMIRT